MTGPTLNADLGALGAARSVFEDVAATLRELPGKVATGFDDVREGAGEFGDLVVPGASAFLLSWRQALGVCEHSSGLIAGNLGRTAVDLRAVDEGSRLQVVL